MLLVAGIGALGTPTLVKVNAVTNVVLEKMVPFFKAAFTPRKPRAIARGFNRIIDRTILCYAGAMQKIALVTGGAGFIGSHLCERLVTEGYRVISLDNYFTGTMENHVEGVEYIEGHTKDIDQLIVQKPNIIFHLGEYARVEQSFGDIKQVFELNSRGTQAVVEFVRKTNAKRIYAGSSTKFADGGIGRNQSPYAWTKASNTELVQNYGEWFGISYAITYFYNVYGPRERSDSQTGTVISIFDALKKVNKSLTVRLPGTQKRNLLTCTT